MPPSACTLLQTAVLVYGPEPPFSRPRSALESPRGEPTSQQQSCLASSPRTSTGSMPRSGKHHISRTLRAPAQSLSLSSSLQSESMLLVQRQRLHLQFCDHVSEGCLHDGTWRRLLDDPRLDVSPPLTWHISNTHSGEFGAAIACQPKHANLVDAQQGCAGAETVQADRCD